MSASSSQPSATGAPRLSGIHHVTFVVGELDAGVAWYERVLGARHVPRFDHHDASGDRYGVILELPGFPGMVELRIATEDYPVPRGYDPVTFEVPDEGTLDAWHRHLTSEQVDCSEIKRRRTGRSVEFTTPEGALLRLFTAPAGGFRQVVFQEDHVDH